MIPYSRQSVTSRDIRAVQKTLGSDWITQGPRVAEFEQKFSRKTGARYAVAVANGTAALHLACLALGLEPGDRVLTSPITFLASANCILYAGGRPVFADIDPDTLNLSVSAAAARISEGVRGVLPVHFAGLPCDMETLSDLARKAGAFILEDGCHALGARYRAGSKWHRVGSCAHSDACVFSFHPVKAMTTGEGGMITTNRRDLYDRLVSLRSHGTVKDGALLENTDLAFGSLGGKKAQAPWYYEMQSLGFNYRLTDIQSALGSSQLDRLEKFVGKRRGIAAVYDRFFSRHPACGIFREPEGFRSAYHLYVLRLNLEKLDCGRFEIFCELRERGLGVQVHYIPVPWQPYYRRLGYRREDYPEAGRYYSRAVSIPIYPDMTKKDVRTVTDTVARVLDRHEAKEKTK